MLVGAFKVNPKGDSGVSPASDEDGTDNEVDVEGHDDDENDILEVSNDVGEEVPLIALEGLYATVAASSFLPTSHQGSKGFKSFLKKPTTSLGSSKRLKLTRNPSPLVVHLDDEGHVSSRDHDKARAPSSFSKGKGRVSKDAGRCSGIVC